MWPGFESWTLHHKWVEFVAGFVSLLQGFFSGFFDFPLSTKTLKSKHFQFDLEKLIDEEVRLRLVHVQLENWCSLNPDGWANY